MIARARPPAAAGAIELLFQRDMTRAIRTDPARVGGTEQADHGRAHRRRQMHRPRVVADHQRRLFHQRGELQQAAGTGQINGAGAQVAQDLIDMANLFFGGDQNDPRADA